MWDDLSNLSEQNATLCQELSLSTAKQEQIQQDLTTAKETIKQLEKNELKAQIVQSPPWKIKQ